MAVVRATKHSQLDEEKIAIVRCQETHIAIITAPFEANKMEKRIFRNLLRKLTLSRRWPVRRIYGVPSIPPIQGTCPFAQELTCDLHPMSNDKRRGFCHVGNAYPHQYSVFERMKYSPNESFFPQSSFTRRRFGFKHMFCAL